MTKFKKTPKQQKVKPNHNPKAKIGEWHDRASMPTKVGVYQRKSSTTGIFWSRWDGNRWMAMVPTSSSVIYNTANFNRASSERIISTFQSLPWRGITYE